MENKQQAILDLYRATLAMLHHLTFVSPSNTHKDIIKHHLDEVKFYIGIFEDVFLKEKENAK